MRGKKKDVHVWVLLVVLMLFMSLFAVIVSADSSAEGDEKKGRAFLSTRVVQDETDAATSVGSSPPTIDGSGSIAGRVTDTNGTGIYNAYVLAYGGASDRRAGTRTNLTGYYSFTTLPLGAYLLIVYPVPGTYLLSNTTGAIVIPGGTWPADVVLKPAPDIWIYPLYFDMFLSQGDVATRTLAISNNGTGILEFELPLPEGRWIFADPIEGSLVDIKNGYAWVNSTHISFWIETSTFIPENASEMYCGLWLDTDQNSSTGVRDELIPGYGLNDLGADYVVFLDPYNFEAALNRWTGDNIEFISDLALDVNAFCFEFSIPLSDIADDGFMDVTFVEMTSGNVFSDVAPDEGHGTTGNGANWLTEYPTIGTMELNNLTEITITVNTTDLEVGEYNAAIFIKSNDPDENPIVPINLTILPREVGYLDTGTSAIPYPSISGTHNGTLTTFYDINISRMYTYSCLGTGGHTEYAAILHSNGTVLAEAHWNGYTSDWRNLTFNNSFTLYANETYNYTIVTGAYPQIIHAPSWNATGGVITCTDFVDINRKRHEGWIPAIRLH
jgi:hypothetical protein